MLINGGILFKSTHAGLLKLVSISTCASRLFVTAIDWPRVICPPWFQFVLSPDIRKTSRNLPPSATAFPIVTGKRRDISRALSPRALGKKSVKEQLSWELHLCRINKSVEHFPRWMTQSPLVSDTPSSSRDLELPGSQSKILRDPDQTPSHSSRLRLLMNVSVDNDRSKQLWFKQCTVWFAHGGLEIVNLYLEHCRLMGLKWIHD